MKKTLLFLYSILFATLVSADEFGKNYGRGVVHIQFDSISNVRFYSSPDAKTHSHHISIIPNACNIGTHYVSVTT
jgi:hypothetical protein